MPETMQTIVKPQAGKGLVLAERPVPTFGPNEVLVKVEAASICGTDYHIYTWDDWSANRIKPPLIVGHEFAGEVVAIGKDVSRVRVGDRISAETHIVCNKCYQCRTGEAHVCRDVEIIGVDRDGAFAEYVVIPEENAWLNDPDLPPALGSIQEPLGNAVHTVLAGPIAGAEVAILGCGPIGLMSIAVAKAVGAKGVIATDLNPYRLDLAKKMGADVVLNPKEVDVVAEIKRLTADRGGVDVTLEMSGHETAIRQGLAITRNGGRVSLLGLPAKPVELDLTEQMIFKGLTLQGITGRLMYDTWYQVKGLLASGNLNIEPIITHRFPLSDFEQGMELMARGTCGKIILDI